MKIKIENIKSENIQDLFYSTNTKFLYRKKYKGNLSAISLFYPRYDNVL